MEVMLIILEVAGLVLLVLYIHDYHEVLKENAPPHSTS